MRAHHARQLVALALLCFWLAVVGLVVAAPLAPIVGSLVSFVWPGTTDSICARITQLQLGADGRPWAILVDERDRRRVYRWPLAELTTGCPTT